MDNKLCDEDDDLIRHKELTSDKFQPQIVWKNVFLISLVHALALVGLFYSFFRIRWITLFIGYGFTLLANLLGITAGAHRLWSHRSYKAKLPLRIFLMIANTLALQNDIYVWCRDHRVHHKYSETDADPHNSRRGFFFAHMGWLMYRKHPDVIAKGHTIDLSDLEQDPVVMFQRKYYKPLVVIFWFLLPTIVPHILWNENVIHSFFVCVCFRYVFALHSTWLVNSAAHFFGAQTYDKRIQPRENEFVIFASFGEGYHNYHHVFPWNYSTSEFGWMTNFNFTTFLIDCFALLGQVKERKVVSHEIVRNRINRTGNGKPYRRNTVAHQITGLTVGTFPIWFPACLRVAGNYLNNRQLLL